MRSFVQEGFKQLVEFLGIGDGDVSVFVALLSIKIAFLYDASVNSDHREQPPKIVHANAGSSQTSFVLQFGHIVDTNAHILCTVSIYRRCKMF